MTLTLYFLVWPAVSAVIMGILVVALWRDLRAAKRSGQAMI